MNLTTTMLEPYTHGGQLEIYDPAERYLGQGEIFTAIVEGDMLKVTFAWFGVFDAGEWWRSTEDLDVELKLGHYDVTVVGKRVILHSVTIGELLTFLLPGDKTISRHRLKFKNE